MNKTRLLELAKKMHALADAVLAECGEEKKTDLEKPEVSLEQLRGFLAEKSQLGFAAEVRALIHSFGGERLSDIEPEFFPGMLQEAEEIGNA